MYDKVRFPVDEKPRLSMSTLYRGNEFQNLKWLVPQNTFAIQCGYGKAWVTSDTIKALPAFILIESAVQ